MYYLRKEPYTIVIDEIKKTDGTVIPQRAHTLNDRAIYKSNEYNRFYRETFDGQNKHYCTHLYTCKSLKHILGLRKDTYDYCNEWFDVYDENGKVDIEVNDNEY